jgi:uncharacterized membrane protein
VNAEREQSGRMERQEQSAPLRDSDGAAREAAVAPVPDETPLDEQVTAVHVVAPLAPTAGATHGGQPASSSPPDANAPAPDLPPATFATAAAPPYAEIPAPPLWPGGPGELPYPAPLAHTPPRTNAPWLATASWGMATFTMNAGTAAGLSYLLWWVSGMLIYFNERQNRYVRFHAMQSIVLTGTLTVFSVVAYFIWAVFGDLYMATGQHIYHTIGIGIAGIALFVVAFSWLGAMIAAWSGYYLRLPIVGAYAERYAASPIQPHKAD